MSEVVSSRGIGAPFSLAIKILKCEKKVNGDVLLMVRNFVLWARMKFIFAREGTNSQTSNFCNIFVLPYGTDFNLLKIR